MTNNKIAKKALFSSVIALFFCFTMFIGTTFAWFTDSVTSGSNVITSGNLDFEVQYTLDGENWEDLDGAEDLFQKGSWEPGHTEVVVLKVKNVGSLVLKYVANMNITKEVKGKTKDGQDIVLSDLLEVSTLTVEDAGIDPVFGINIGQMTVQKAFEDEDAIGWGSPAPFNQTNAVVSDKQLNVGSTQYVLVKVDMPETVGNEANHNGVDVPSIEFGINVLATQYIYEEDSYGSDYDADAVYYDALVTTDEEFLEALNDTDVKYIAIDGDVTYDWGADSYANSKALLMKGKTIFGLNENDSVTFKGYGSANPITDVTLKNITVYDETEGDNEGSWEHGHLEFVSLKAEKVEFANSIMLSGNSVLTDCTLNNQVASWYGLWINAGTTVLKDCEFKGTRAVKIHEAYASNVDSVIIEGCYFECSEKPGVVIGDLDASTVVTIEDCEFNGCQPGDQNKYIYESDTDVTTFKFVETNNTIK